MHFRDKFESKAFKLSIKRKHYSILVTVMDLFGKCWKWFSQNLDFFAEFFCAVSLLCFHNTLIITNFDVLKYIKKIFKISIQYIFNVEQMTTQKKINRESELVFPLQYELVKKHIH